MQTNHTKTEEFRGIDVGIHLAETFKRGGSVC